MDPQVKSFVSSVAMMVATAVAGWAASAGIVPTGDQSVLANQLALAASGLVMASLAWYKARQVSKAAVIAQVNSQDNGVKVVPASAPVDAVNQPLK